MIDEYQKEYREIESPKIERITRELPKPEWKRYA